MKIAFYELRPGEEEYFKTNLSTHNLSFINETLNQNNLITDCEILSVVVYSKVDKDILSKLPNLKLIVTRSTGFDHIDLKSAQEKNIYVTNIPNYSEVTVAEYAFALILACSRKIIPSSLDVLKNKRFITDSFQGFDLSKKVIGVVGTGKIGRNVIRIAKGFNMQIAAFDVYPDFDLARTNSFEYVPFDELLKISDILTFHVPALPDTFHMVNMQNVNILKKGVLIINTSRGSVIETQALISGLDQGIITATGLDVLEEEGLLKNGQTNNLIGNLLGRENVLITPHNAFNSKEAHERVLKTTIENISAFLTNEPINLIR
ncbi:hydroxyacid dehydrogenase [Candidatus Daviesbacteria bacterium]|nr:hydroxyacid dehydrogenase [Candidatus Daviesbacteria bacterium]